MARLMTTHEVAEYLRIKERKVYELVGKGQIPCTRATGKWLFPRDMIDIWLAEGAVVPGDGAQRARIVGQAPPIIAGSHDPLLDWSLFESGCGLAMLGGGSLDGLTRFAAGEAVAAGLHVLDPKSGAYNIAAIERACPGGGDMVAIEWAVRAQGLIVAPDNPLRLTGIADLATSGARVVVRQPGAGSRILFEHLIAVAGLGHGDLTILPDPALNETELGLAILEGKADAGIAVAAAARPLRLMHIPLADERYDLLIRWRDYFEEPFQKLLAFTRSRGFAERARAMAGYDVTGLGRVRRNFR